MLSPGQVQSNPGAQVMAAPWSARVSGLERREGVTPTKVSWWQPDAFSRRAALIVVASQKSATEPNSALP